MIWEKKDVDQEEVKDLARQYGMDLLTASILVRRGITRGEDVSFFLEDDTRLLHNPFLLEGMEEAVDRINAALEAGEKIYIFGDRDVDGITSTVMLTETLRGYGGTVDWAVPMGDESYGLSREVIDKVKDVGASLLITVDCGVSNFDEIEYAGSLDIDTIVVDHHNPHDYLPDALVIINPKLDESAYPFRDLCGCAVASKLVWALAFSRTRYYNARFCLLNISPANETYVVEALKLHNLVEVDKTVEMVMPGVLKLEQSRFYELLEGDEVFVYDRETQEHQFHKVFGSSGGLSFIDLKEPVVRAFSFLEGKSLLKVKELSKLARYSSRPLKEIEMFRNLVISYVIKSETSLSAVLQDKLPLVALGTLADIMPLLNENRILVKQGLHSLGKCTNPGLRQLLFKQNLWGKEITSQDVSWHISPVINASGRMGEPHKAVELFLSRDDKEIDELVEYIISLNKKRKALGDKTWKSMTPKAKTSFEKTGEKMVLVADRSIHRGITGILATRLVSYFRVPAIVIAYLEGKMVGSMRSTREVNSKTFLHQFEDLFFDFGGHDMAAGFSLPPEKLDEFKTRFYQVAGTLEEARSGEEKIVVDAEIPLPFLNLNIRKVVELFDPYGEENRSLYFLSRGLRVVSVDLIGKAKADHVKMLLDAGQTRWPAFMWNASERVGRDFDQNDKVDIVYQVTKNFYQNTETLRLVIMDIKRS